MLSLLCLASGVFILLIASGFIPVGEAQPQAPGPIVALSGMVFVIAGCMMLLAHRARVNDLLAAVMCLIFGIVAAWVSLFSSNDGFSGGLPLLSYEHNVLIARWVFGLGSLVCFAISAWAFKRFVRPDT